MKYTLVFAIRIAGEHIYFKINSFKSHINTVIIIFDFDKILQATQLIINERIEILEGFFFAYDKIRLLILK